MNNIAYKNSVVKEKQRAPFTKVSWLMLFKEIIAVYSENYTKHIHTFCRRNTELLNAKAGTCSMYNYTEL
jgi:hypothetical protein